MPKQEIGGFVTCRPKHIDLPYGKELGITLMSDLHIGAPNVNYHLIKKELERAKKNGDRICINGDVFDMILHQDQKRFSPDSLHSRLHGRRDVINAAIDWAVELLLPYANLIDMIGIGNHETAIEKHHSVDMTRVLIYDLSRKLAKPHKDHLIHYGGYMGFVDYRIGGYRWILYYFHGKGGGSATTLGAGDFSKKAVMVVADCIWMGHNHHQMVSGIERIECPMTGQGPLITRVRYIRTGAYMHIYRGQTQKSIKKNGRRSNYAADAGMVPGLQGGARVLFRKTKSFLNVEVVQ